MIIYIEGNIGTGKTTLLEIIKTYFPNKNNTVIYEPVDQWKLVKDEHGVNLLDKFYSDIQKWSFAFQMNSFISRIHRVMEQRKDDNTVNLIIEVPFPIFILIKVYSLYLMIKSIWS